MKTFPGFSFFVFLFLFLIVFVPSSVFAAGRHYRGGSTSQQASGWYVTGYFTPVESDYGGSNETISVDGEWYDANTNFLYAVETQGWGRTNMGYYIGWFNDGWHFSDVPLDANNRPLLVGAVAVDPAYVPLGSNISIPSLPQGFGGSAFTATDIGPGIVGKHIDVYAGEGSSAENLAYALTGTNTVCKY
jgi:3D (Asp-Asp-Asp) domain-containing protein